MVPWGCLRFVIVVFPDHTRLLFLVRIRAKIETTTLFVKAFDRIRATIEKTHFVARFWLENGQNRVKRPFCVWL